jgi:hypothetical protein
MSLKALTHVWEHSKQEGGNLLVMLALADYADEKGRSFPAIATLAKKSRLSERQVQRATKKLEEDGEIEILKNAGMCGSNVYQIKRLTSGDKMSPCQNVGGDMDGKNGVTPTTPKPPGEPPDHKEKARCSLDQVRAFAVEMGCPASDGDSMFDHWEANGWKVGANKMKDWKATFRYWHRNNYLPSQKNVRNGSHQKTPSPSNRATGQIGVGIGRYADLAD